MCKLARVICYTVYYHKIFIFLVLRYFVRPQTRSSVTHPHESIRLSSISMVWWSGVVVSTVALINEINLRRARLVLRWVTVSGSITGAGHLFQYVTNQPPKANSAFHPSGVGK